MDAQQIIALAIVAAAATLLAIRQVRRRRSPKAPECANCTMHDHEHTVTSHPKSTDSNQR